MNTTEQFKHIILQHQPAMQRMAESLLHDEMAAEDAVQDAMVDLWKQRDTLIAAHSTEAFCITMVKRRCIDTLRRQRPTQAIDEQALMAADPPPDDTEEHYRQAMQMVNNLPDLQRKVVMMKYHDDMDTSAITQQLHISTANLYTTLSRAISNLRKMLNNER